MFKKFLMENAHRESIKNLFRWWNGQVFSFETASGTNREDDGFDSGMDEAEAALNSDEEFSDAGGEEFGASGEKLGDDTDSFYAAPEELQADQPLTALQMNMDSRPDNLSIDFMQLTISEHSVAPSNPLAAPVHAIAVPWVREPTLVQVHSAGVATNITTFRSFTQYLTLLMISGG
jgi:hypothetical protein